MLPQPKSIDSFTALLASEAARPAATRAKVASIEATAAATLEQFDRQPVEADLAQVLTAQSTALASRAMLASIDRFTVESRGQALADAAARTHKDTGKPLLEGELAERLKPRAAKHASLGKAAAIDQAALMNPDLSQDEWAALEDHRAGLVGQAESLEASLSNARSAIERFSNGPSAETWHDAVRAVRAVDFS